jgi:hypothetical protein
MLLLHNKYATLQIGTHVTVTLQIGTFSLQIGIYVTLRIGTHVTLHIGTLVTLHVRRILLRWCETTAVSSGHKG